jgi:Fe-S oxidoreductase
VFALQHSGFDVAVPDGPLCCGRPLYDWGMLGLAERLLRRVLAALREDIRAGTPLVVLEPSCLSVFRDEATNLLAHDEDARRLARQSFTLGEFLSREAQGQPWPRLPRSALVQGHCHQKAVVGMSADLSLLRSVLEPVDCPDSGCCGMAGAFGFEAGKFEVSVKAAERVLLPAVRAAGEDTLIVADGFSCREQIEQCTGRPALHTAEVLALALREGAPPADRAREPDLHAAPVAAGSPA